MTDDKPAAPAPDVPYAVWRQGFDAVAKWKDTTAPDADAIMALADEFHGQPFQDVAAFRKARAALRAAVEQIVRSLSAWEQVWEGIRDNHEPNLNPANKPLAVAAIFQLAINRVERAERESDELRALLREARPIVMRSDYNSVEGYGPPSELLARIDAALKEGK